MITVREALNRGYNLLGVGIIAISGLAFFSDLPAEINQPSHLVDEVLLAFLALMAFIWYLSGRNNYSRTVLPIVFAVLALAIKVLGLFLELSDPEDRGMNSAHWSSLGSRSSSWSGNTSPLVAWLRVFKRRNRQQMQSRSGSGSPLEDERKARKRRNGRKEAMSPHTQDSAHHHSHGQNENLGSDARRGQDAWGIDHTPAHCSACGYARIARLFHHLHLHDSHALRPLTYHTPSGEGSTISNLPSFFPLTAQLGEEK